MAKLILTGCAGFIGFNFLKHAVNSGVMRKYDDVISIDKMGYATRFNTKEYWEICQENKIICYDMPICQFTSKDPIFKDNSEFDVVNFASESHVDNSIVAPYSIFNENSVIASQLVEAIKPEKIRKFIQISTDEVYGDLPLDSDYVDWFTPETNFHPNNPYSASKLAQDAFLMSMSHTFGLKVQFVRMANQFGPYQHPEKMLPASVLRVLKNEPIKIYGTGRNIRQWTPVKQTVEAIYDLLFDGICCPTIHLAKHYNPLEDNNSVVEIWRKLLKNMYNLDSSVEYIEDRKGHDQMYALKTSTEIDEYFDTKLEDEFAETIRHYVERKEHYFEPK